MVVSSSLRKGGLAQWESSCLTSRLSWVQIPHPPDTVPVLSINIGTVDFQSTIFHDISMGNTGIKRISSPILSSRRLVLRPFTLDDTIALFSWASDAEVTRFLRFPVHHTIQESERVIKKWIDNEKHPPFFHWAIETRDEMEVIGSIGIEITSLHDNRGEIGYCLSKRAWNRGFATEALRTVLEFGLERAGFHRIEAAHAVENVASGKVMQKAGMTCEAGPLRDYYKADLLGYQDVFLYVAFESEMN